MLAVHNLPRPKRFHNSFKLHFYIIFLVINEYIQILQNINPTFYHTRESRGIFNLPFFSRKERDDEAVNYPTHSFYLKEVHNKNNVAWNMKTVEINGVFCLITYIDMSLFIFLNVFS